MTRLEIHIGELVLHGIDPADRERIAADLERELGRLLAERGLPPAAARGGSLHLEDAALTLPAGSPPEELGAAIARHAHGRLFPVEMPAETPAPAAVADAGPNTAPGVPSMPHAAPR